jgi:hypothetical protein
MKTRGIWVLLAAGVVAAQAQARCYAVVQGRVVEQSCEAAAALRMARETPSEMNRYLSPECATLNDGMRSAAKQGNYNTVMDLRREFARKCADEVSDAYSQRSQEQQRQSEHRQEQRREAEAAQARTREQQEQCTGMRDVIQSRRKREATLNPTEVTALRQLEASYNERCLR